MSMTSIASSVLAIVIQPWRNRHIVLTLAARELSARYRGSLLGGLWTILQPMAVVALFYYVLVVIFKTRWSSDSLSGGDFVVGMFIGLLIYNVFAETVGRSTGAIVSNVNYVKKVVFPIAVFPIINLVFALVNFATGLLVLIIFGLLWGVVRFDVTWMALPLVLFPVSFLALGVSWFTSALNVYFRDTAIIIPLLLQATMFLSPVFYNFDRASASVQSILIWSPLTIPITLARRIVMEGRIEGLASLLLSTMVAVVLMVLGYVFFRRIKPGFADVL